MTKYSSAFVMYPVTDMPRAVEFYESKLGLTKGDLVMDFWVEFSIGDLTFGIGNFEQVGTPGSAKSFALEVPDLDALRQQLATHGIETMEPHDLPKCRISSVKDPDGNQILLHELKAA